MKRQLLIGAFAVAAAVTAATPAIAGLAGNSSFSHEIPVRVPAQTLAAQLVDDRTPLGSASPSPRATGSPESAVSSGASPTEDNPARHAGASPSASPQDRSGRGSTSASTTAAHPSTSPAATPDDHGRASSEPGDDRTARPAASASPEPGDDSGGHGGGSGGGSGRGNDGGGSGRGGSNEVASSTSGGHGRG